MDLLKTFGPLLGSVAPTLATALGGPLAGLAVKSLSKALLGAEDFSEEAVMEAMATASPEQLAAVKKIDADFKVQMKSLDIDLERIAVDDRKSARDMQKETRDWIHDRQRGIVVVARCATDCLGWHYSVLFWIVIWQSKKGCYDL